MDNKLNERNSLQENIDKVLKEMASEASGGYALSVFWLINAYDDSKRTLGR